MQLRIGQIGNARISMYVQYSTSKYRGTAAYSISVLAWYGVQLYSVHVRLHAPSRAAGPFTVNMCAHTAVQYGRGGPSAHAPRPPEAQNSELLCVPR